MKKSILLLTSLSLLSGMLAAQEGDGLPSVRRAVETIAEVDQQSAELQAEVLDTEDSGEPPTVEVVELNPVEPADGTVPQSEENPSDAVGEDVLADQTVVLDLPSAATDQSSASMGAETISVDFPEEDVREIIRSVAELYELNVVIPDALIGRVSIKLRDVTWQQVFNVVLEPMRFTYLVDGNIIKIKSVDDLALEPVDTRVFVVDFAVAGEIRGSIEPLVDAAVGGRVQVDTRSNALVITERPSRMNVIQEIIETLDRPTEQVMIESKFVEILVRDNRQVGVDWASLSGLSLSAGPFEREYLAERGRDRNQISQSSEIFNQTNNLPGELTITEGSQFLSERPVTILNTDTALFSADAFRMVISALETNTDVELVSNPTVVTMNNAPAQINIGEEYPIPQYTYNQEIGRFEISGFDFKNIGINLEVTPQINSAGFINLRIKPEISSRSGEVGFGGASGTVVPIISTRKTNSTVSIKSGYTLAIGGLIEQTTERNDTKVPLLGSIPGLGKLFSSSGKSIDERNLIVFITARILSASGATYRDVFSQRTLYEMGIKSRDLPGYEPPTQERELFDNIQRARDEIELLESELKLRKQLQMFNSVRDKNATKVDEQKGATREERTVSRRYQ